MIAPFRTGGARGIPAWLGVLCVLSLAQAAPAREFGRNKVQYGHRDWYTVSTRHFDLHFAGNGGAIGEFAALRMEAMYDTVSRILGFPLKDKVPVILYGTPAEFQQTNIIPYLLPEGVGGFTEIFKNRVVVPFEASYPDFHHVLQHELVHAFLFDRQNALGNKFAAAQGQVPLWFGEGLAEYASLGWDLGSEFYMQDAVTFGYVGNPARDGLPGFLAYKGGQLFYYYLAQTFGPGFIRDWVGQVARGKDLEKSFQDLAKVSLKEVGEIWLREIRAIYWPELRERRYGKTVARQLTDHNEDLSNLNMQPALSPDGKRIAFFSDRKPMLGIYIMDVEKEKVVRSLAQAGSERGHMSFYPYQSRISWSPDGKRLAFVSKTGDRDAISIAEAEGRGKVRQVKPPGIQGILSPAFSPDGNRIVFTGMQDGFTDLFVWDLPGGTLRRLTHDIAADHNPVFAPSGGWIAFESDRTRPDLPQDPKDPFAGDLPLSPFRDIWRISADGGLPSRILGGPYDEKMPAFGPSDTELVFVSNRSGINNLYLARAPETGGAAGEWRAQPISNLTSTCFTPSWSKAGDRLAFSLFENRGWDVFVMRNPRDRLIADSLPKTRFIRKMEDTTLRFFSPLALENLSSFVRERKSADSAKAKEGRGRAAESRASAEDSAAGEGVAAGTGVLPAPRAGGGAGPDSLRTAAPSPEAAAPPGGLPPPVPSDPEGRHAGTEEAKAGPPGPDPASADGAAAAAASAGPAATTPAQDTAQVAGTRITRETDYLTRLGSYKLRPYRPKWGLELAAADLGYNTFSRGISGQSYITVSDLLGNHKINFTLSSGGQGFRSTNGLVMYDLLPYRTDFSFLAFNFTNYLAAAPGLYFYDREWGGGMSARFPLSVFTRFEADLTGISVTRSLYDDVRGTAVEDSLYPREDLRIVRPGLAWVNDNAEYGITGPVLGRRMRLAANVVPPLFDDSVAFWQADGDFRRYWMLWKKYAFAFRVTGGMSSPLSGYANPQLYLGGGDDLIPFVARTKPGNGPQSLAEVAFSELAVPLRGFRYYEFRGDRKFITNAEFRYPFIETLRVAWPLPFTLHYLMGVAFVDYGGAWSAVPGQGELETALDVLGMGYGYGFRLNLGIFVLRYTRAHTVEGIGIGTDEFRSYWSLGADF